MTQDLVDLMQRLANGETVNFHRDDGTPCQIRPEEGTVNFYVNGSRSVNCEPWGLSTFIKVASLCKKAAAKLEPTSERHIEI